MNTSLTKTVRNTEMEHIFVKNVTTNASQTKTLKKFANLKGEMNYE